MNLDDVTVGHVITVDFGPDRRGWACKVWDWLQDKEPDYGLRCFSFSTADNDSQRENKLPARHILVSVSSARHSRVKVSTTLKTGSRCRSQSRRWQNQSPIPDSALLTLAMMRKFGSGA
jgi:hypothetical protein